MEATVEAIEGSIETNLFLANAYASQGAAGLAAECALAASLEYTRFSAVLLRYGDAKLAAAVGMAERKYLAEASR